MTRFTGVREAAEAYKRGEATLDEVSQAAARTIAADLHRRGVTWEATATITPATESRSA